MIQDILPRYQETANGSKKAFVVPFDTLDSNYIIVYLDSNRQNSGYTVAGNTITFATAPANNTLVTIQRVLPIEWTSNNIGALNLESLGNILTQIVAQIQTIKEEVKRAVKTNPYDEDDGGSMSEDFLSQLREAEDILDEFKRTAEDLMAAKEEIDAFIAAIADLEGIVEEIKYIYNNRGRTAYFDLWPAGRL